VSGQSPCPANASESVPITPPSWRCDALKAPSHWQRIDFISDLHLDASRPKTFDAFAHYLDHTPADAVFILGDLFELWVGDDMAQLPFESAAQRVLSRAGHRLWLGLMVGNRDFLLGPRFLQSCQAHGLSDPFALTAFGRTHTLSHGDAWCLEDVDYLKFRDMVRQETWQAAFLQRPLAERLAVAKGIRTESEARKQAPGAAMSAWADVATEPAAQAMQAMGAQSLIHGHTHMPASEAFALPGASRHVLSDWELDHAPSRAEVLRLDAQGLQRLNLQQALLG
jgi:UDP-2,3-diacylglucosamine hydrolase